ncbi:Retrovirus-related Pol polyprotein from transposon TNT 1-94 [Araneus ventricosus]|uniref:Retrovirus-related Pol polyprotein from transposon TNT 1-94 n=1 Tax=Araneus ventricosus TaxID=182803 RepID=A0A4Y2QAE0_ARAVE|nr:Retrovirus-related Pol polyprotein from transposon TNT 1-94 [Araneus ventricosus]
MTFEPEKFNFKATTKYSDTNQSSENDSRSKEGSNSDEIYETLEYECYNSELPKTFEDTQRSKDKEKWDFAMREELNMINSKVSLLGWNRVQLDAKSAYLYGKLNEKVYLKQPPGFIVKVAESKVYLLHKALYGLHQSGRSWNCELYNILKDLKFDKLLWSNCLYKNKDVILVIYVDDILFGKALNDINKTIALIKSKLDLTELGPAKYLLGVNFEMNKDLFMHQKTYIEKLIIKFKELPKSNVNLPIKLGSKLPEKIKEKDIVENELMSKFPYRSLIGCLSFLADRTRPDISFSVNLMSQFSNGYTFEQWKIVVYIMNYVFKTKDYKINLSNVKNSNLTCYTDANWGCNLTDILQVDI